MTDNFLQILVSAINQSKTSIGVTLTVKGIVISGMLASVEDYVEWFDKVMHTDFASATGEKKPSPTKDDLSVQAVAEKLPPVEYIHLRNVEIRSGGQSVSLRGSFWRGKLDDVDGFMLGIPASNV